MFEVFKRFGKFLKYGFQSILIIFIIFELFCNGLNKETGWVLIGLITIAGVIELIARAFVWIISGYFETRSESNISSSQLKQMREYYTCYHLKNKMLKLLQKL